MQFRSQTSWRVQLSNKYNKNIAPNKKHAEQQQQKQTKCLREPNQKS